MYMPKIPDNGLKPQLEELVHIAEMLDKETDELCIKFNFPASEKEINRLEKELNISLPIGYKEFLRFSNGATFCGNTARFGDIDKVIDFNKMDTVSDFPKDHITVASIIGDGELLCFSKDTGKFIRYFDGEETVFDDFYSAFQWIIEFVKELAEDYIEL